MSAVRLSGNTETKASEQVTAVDQKKINKFARLNNQLEDIKASIKKLQGDTENLGDAGDEVMLGDDSTPVLLKIGDTFVEYAPDVLQEKLEEMKASREEESAALSRSAEGVKEEMNSLKVQLYAKFGSAINLEHDDAE